MDDPSQIGSLSLAIAELLIALHISALLLLSARMICPKRWIGLCLFGWLLVVAISAQSARLLLGIISPIDPKIDSLLDWIYSLSSPLAWAVAVLGFYAAPSTLHLIREHQRLARQCSRDSVTDPLTGIGNRRAIELFSQPTQSVVYVDLNNFGLLNKIAGQSVGDDLLKEVAARIRSTVGSKGLCVRMGGDEFAIFLPFGGDAIELVPALSQHLKLPYRKGFTVSASIGFAVGFHPLNDLISFAEVAMRQAKRTGNDYWLFDEALAEGYRLELELEKDLPGAIERGEIYLEYQPIVRLEDRRIIGVEALARWRHFRRGLIPPSVFVPIAERSGKIGALFDRVREIAFDQARVWQRYGVWVAVNVSAIQLSQINFAAEVLKAMDGLESIHLEITESAITDDADIIKVLQKLKDARIVLAIDDFGTGQSSLSRLDKLPVSYLKLDRLFINGLEKNAKKRLLCKHVIALADDLDIEVIAEGVETERQVEQLREFRCGFAQGFLFSRPVSPSRVEELIRAQL